MKNKEYKLRIKRGKIAEFFKSVLRLFKKKPQIINQSGGELPDQAIYLSNHAGANGPFTYELHFPKRITPWGTHEMCGNYRERWNYLYYTFYQQKLHWGKFKAFIVATIFAIFSKRMYNSVGLIGTYTDNRFLTTVKSSCKVLDANSALLIFPEDSASGYHEPPRSYFKGCTTMARMYYRLRKVDLPVYPMYFSGKKRKIIIDKPVYVNKLLDQGMTEEQIVAQILATTVQMHVDHVQNAA